MGDYVDRQKLKEAISADFQHLFSFDTSLYETFMIDIDEMPSANVREDVQAKWGNDDCCTNCGQEAEYNWERGIHFYSKFCPECGARMKL